MSNPKFTGQPELAKALYGGSSMEERRQKLMPFMWNVIAKQGSILGNRELKSYVNIANPLAFSYAGYSEMFTASSSMIQTTNSRKKNRFRNVFMELNQLPEYRGRIAVFSSWNVIPYVLKNPKKDIIHTNAGHEEVGIGSDDSLLNAINYFQKHIVHNKEATRNDQLTFLAAKEYLNQKKPAVLYLSLGETDEFAHQGDYYMYLQKAAEADRIIGELWYWAQSQPGYKDNTTFIITTDHGRGNKANKWPHHKLALKGSHQVWLAMLGEKIMPVGEARGGKQVYLKQIAQTIASLAGTDFGRENPVYVLSEK